MDLLWALLTLPYAPVRGLTAVVKLVAREAESQQHNPVNIRRELEDLDRAEAAGEITREQRDRGQRQVVNRLLPPGAGTAAPATDTPAPATGTAGPATSGPLRRPPPAGRRRTAGGPVERRRGDDRGRGG